MFLNQIILRVHYPADHVIHVSAIMITFIYSKVNNVFTDEYHACNLYIKHFRIQESLGHEI